jgi:hypothetical protein
VSNGAAVEQQLAVVQRDFDSNGSSMRSSSKLHTAAIAENVKSDRSGEQFMVLTRNDADDADRQCRGA